MMWFLIARNRDGKLVTTDSNINLDPTGECHEEVFQVRKPLQVSDAEFGVSWEEACVKTLQRFFELFSGHYISADTLSKWVQRFRDRTH
jgi:hypothetical protein